MLPDLPILKNDIQKFYDQYIREKVNSNNGIFNEFPKLLSHEGNRIRLLRADGTVQELRPKEFIADIVIPLADNHQLTIKQRKDKIDEIAKKLYSQKIKEFFETMSNELDKAGQTIDLKGEPLNIDAVFTCFEKIECDFDEEGDITTILAPPNLILELDKLFKQIMTSPELMKRHEEIMAKKRMAWRDREASRKLVG